MRKKFRQVLALMLIAVLLLGAAPYPEEGTEGETAEPELGDIAKNLSREEDKSLLPQNSWTDIENMAYWQKLFAGIKHSGNWGEDLVHIAKTQLGYTESILNVRRDHDGEVHGYTRYGGWYGAPHAEWCAMFVSFCLYFAWIPEEYVPYEASCGRWEGALREKSLYTDSKDYVPRRGDLVFFGEHGVPSHVGIVLELNEETGELRYIHGHSVDNDVAIGSIRWGNGSIVGYGMLPENLAACMTESAA